MTSDRRLTAPRDHRIAVLLPGLSGTQFGGLAALLVAEGVILAVRYHWTVLAEERLGYGLGYARGLTEPILPTALATALVTALSVRRQLRRPPGDRRPPAPAPRWPFLLAHLAAFVAFARVLAYLVAGDPAASSYPDARAIARLIGDPWLSPLRAYWVGAAALLGVAALVFWEAAVFPPPRQHPWRWRGWRPLLTGMGIGLAAVAAGRGVEASWPVLGRATLGAVHLLLTLAFPEVVYRPADAVVGTPGFAVRIAPACSGYEGIGLVLVYVGAYLWFDRHHLRFPRALLLLPLGAAVMWLANALRIAALVAVGAWASPGVALRGFHIQAGWLAVNAVALGLVAAARRARCVRAGPAAGGSPPPTAAYLTPLLALVAAAMFTGALCDGFDRLYPARVLAALAALAYFRRAYTGLRWSWSWPAVVQGAVVFALWVGPGPLSPRVAAGGGTPSAWADLPRCWAAAWLIGRVVGSVVVVPLAEELAFRGYLVRRLIAVEFDAVPPGRLTWQSWLISSVLFGALHGQWPAGMAAGAVYALAQRRRGELGDAVLAHGTTNGLLTVYALATGDWSAWS